MQPLSLPAGAIAACCVHLAERTTRPLSRRTAALLTTTGLAAATAVAVSAVLGGAAPHKNQQYLAATVASTAVLTATLCTGRGPLSRLLSTDLLTEVGRMSAPSSSCTSRSTASSNEAAPASTPWPCSWSEQR